MRLIKKLFGRVFNNTSQDGLSKQNFEYRKHIVRKEDGIYYPVRFIKMFEVANEKARKGKELTKMDKTILYGYLNYRNHACNEPHKRVR